MYDLKAEMNDKSKDNIRYRSGKSSESGKNKSQVNAEYFQALEQWLTDIRSYRYSCSFFAGLPYTVMAQQISALSPPHLQGVNNVIPSIPPLNQGLGMFVFPNQQQQPTQIDNAVEYTIPPLWKRFIAESVDFALLFIMKLAITFIAVDFFDFIDLEKYESLRQPEKLDIKLILEVTSEITFLEVAHRIIVCLYEGVFLRKGLQNQTGGSTPGKAFMGLRVILCDRIEQVENQPNVVKVIPAKDLGYGYSFARAFMKNLVLALLLPICFPFFFNKFNRTAYDILCHSVVVEEANRNR